MWKNWKGIAFAAGVVLVLLGLAVGVGYVLGRGTLAGDLAAGKSAVVEFRINAANAARDRENARLALADLGRRIDGLGVGIAGAYERSLKRYDASLKRLESSRSISDRLNGYAELARYCADDAELIDRLIRESGLFGDHGD